MKGTPNWEPRIPKPYKSLDTLYIPISLNPISASHEITLKRVLINGVQIAPGSTLAVTGNRFELAVQMIVVTGPGPQCVNEGYSSTSGRTEGGLGGVPGCASAGSAGLVSSTTTTTAAEVHGSDGRVDPNEPHLERDPRDESVSSVLGEPLHEHEG